MLCVAMFCVAMLCLPMLYLATLYSATLAAGTASASIRVLPRSVFGHAWLVTLMVGQTIKLAIPTWLPTRRVVDGITSPASAARASETHFSSLGPP